MYGQLETYKITYYPNNANNFELGVVLIEAYDRAHAMNTFQENYAGQYRAVRSCERLLG